MSDRHRPAQAHPPPPGSIALRRPAHCTELFLVFTRLAMQGFGGVLAVAQRELVERERWMSAEEFVEALSLAQVLPGPNVINLSLMIGDRFFGWRGALASLAGMLTLPLLVVLGLASLYRHFAAWPVLAGALRGMGVVAAGLIAGTALKLAPSLTRNRLGWPVCLGLLVTTVITVAVWRWPLWAVLAVLGSAGFGLAWRAWKPQATERPHA
jgi:chromate transporter